MTTEPTAPSRRPRRWKRRLLAGLGVLGALVLGALAAFPWLLSTPPGRDWLLQKASAALAPGALRADSIKFSWFGPTRIKWLVLFGAEGRVVEAPAALWDRNLWQILFERPKLGTLRLDRAAVNVERDDQGRIDLYETLRPVISNDPRTALRIEVRGGRLRFRTPELAEALVDDDADIDLAIAPRPGPITWRLALSKPDKAGTALTVAGNLDRWGAHGGTEPDLNLNVAGKGWPLSADARGLNASGAFGGKLSAARTGGAWKLTGDAAVDALAVGGPTLSGDRLTLDRVAAVWDLTESAEGWALNRLELASPLASFRGGGALPRGPEGVEGAEGRVEGTVDLAAIVGQLPNALSLRPDVVLERGTAEVRIVGTVEGGTPRVVASASVDDLRARRGDQTFSQSEPATLGATLAGNGEGAFLVEELSAVAPFLQATATPLEGDGDGFRVVGNYDLGGLGRQLREFVDLGEAAFEGKGKAEGAYRAVGKRYEGRLETTVEGLAVVGMGPVDLRRDEATIAVTLDGPIGGAGLPTGWDRFAADWSTGGLVGDASVENGGPARASAKLPVAVGDDRHELTARLEGRADELGMALDRVEIALAPGRPGLEPLAFAATGRYDAEAGAIRLERVVEEAGGAASAVGLGPEGVQINGLGKGGPAGWVSLEGDLGPLRPWLPEAYRGAGGAWTAYATAGPVEDGLEVGGRFESSGLSWTSEGKTTDAGGPVRLNVRALLPKDADRLDLPELVATSAYGAIEGSGTIADVSRGPRLDLEGKVSPDWEAISRKVAAEVEPGASLSGRPHPFRFKADLSEGLRETAEGFVGLSLDAADVFGLAFGPTAVVGRFGPSGLTVDPIDAEVNDGRLHLEPRIETDEQGGLAVLLDEGSTLSDAVINDRVSHRVLSYVAPVLDNATRARGRVSADITEAVFPLTGDESVKVEGVVVFQEVEFLPGAFLDPILGLINRSDRPLVRLDEPVGWGVADRRVYQTGLSVPVGKLTKIGLEGWVDFDRNLNLVATVPIVPTALADQPLLGGMLGDASVKVPIRGTLDKPKVDGDAFALGMKDLGKTVLEGAVANGAVQLFDRLARPREPGNGPLDGLFRRMAPEERKARRLEKAAERRKKRDGAL